MLDGIILQSAAGGRGEKNTTKLDPSRPFHRTPESVRASHKLLGQSVLGEDNAQDKLLQLNPVSLLFLSTFNPT